jgi:hypothetical protein
MPRNTDRRWKCSLQSLQFVVASDQSNCTKMDRTSSEKHGSRRTQRGILPLGFFARRRVRREFGHDSENPTWRELWPNPGCVNDRGLRTLAELLPCEKAVRAPLHWTRSVGHADVSNRNRYLYWPSWVQQRSDRGWLVVGPSDAPRKHRFQSGNHGTVASCGQRTYRMSFGCRWLRFAAFYRVTNADWRPGTPCSDRHVGYSRLAFKLVLLHTDNVLHIPGLGALP